MIGVGSFDQMSISHLYKERAGLVLRECREGEDRRRLTELRWSDRMCASGIH